MPKLPFLFSLRKVAAMIAVTLLASGCQPQTPNFAITQVALTQLPTIFPSATPIQISVATLTAIPAVSDTPTPEATSTPRCSQENPFNLSAEILDKLGCGGIKITKRSVIMQRFQGGMMIIFAKTSSNVWDSQPGAVIFALSNTGQAWRAIDQFSERPRSQWYQCGNPDPNVDPQDTGIPWRGFGSIWCSNTAIRNALGRALTPEETGSVSNYADYAAGSRVFQVDNFHGFSGWSAGRAYVITFSDSRLGSWRQK